MFLYTLGAFCGGFFFAGFGDGGVSEPPLAGRSAVSTSDSSVSSRRGFTLPLLPGLMCWAAVNLERLVVI